jgi:hypothetical protein
MCVLSFVVQSCTEIADLNVGVSADKDVRWFDVAVDYSVPLGESKR